MLRDSSLGKMLAKMWLNALSDGPAINSQTRNIYAGALTKPSIALSRITTPSGSLSSVLDFKKFNANINGCSKLCQTVLRPKCASPVIAQNRVPGSTITGIVSFHGALFKPMLGVIKWYANGRLPFTTSRSAGNEVKKSGKKKFNSTIMKHSGVNTLNKCQTEERQIQESSKTTKASLKHSPANSHVDVAETSKPMKTLSGFKSKIGKGKPSSPKNNKRPSSTLLKREINVQEPLNSSTEPFTTSGSSGIEVNKSGRTELDSKNKNLSGVNTSKKCQTEQQQSSKTTKGSLKHSPATIQESSKTTKGSLKHSPATIQESSKTTKGSLKHSPANSHVDVAATSKLTKPSLPKNNKKLSSTLLKRETNVQYPLNSSTELTTASDKPQAQKIVWSKVNKSKSTNKNSVKIEKIEKKTSAKDAEQKSQVAVITAKTRGPPQVQGHVDVAETSKILKTQSSSKAKTANGKLSSPKNNKRLSSTLLKRDADQKSQVAVIKAKTMGLPKVNNDEQATERNIMTNKTDKKHSTNVLHKSHAAAGENSKRGNIKVSANPGAHLQESRMIKLNKAKQRELPDNVKLVYRELNENKKANTSVHAEGKVLVVVESATKAKTIQKYLGDMFVVLASYGHVRDLAGRAGSVRPDEDFDMVWEVPTSAWTHIKSIEDASTRARSVILASDPDREGEAIAWHVTEMLKMQSSWNENMLVKRVVFHEITESAIRNAMETPRDISMNLVNAYLARRALDYLIGFNISPILWRKLPGCQSAGRVQSAALSLICDREKEIEDFASQEYWTIEAEACTAERPVPGTNSTALAKVTHLDGEKLEKFTIKSEAEAMKVVEKLSSSKFKVLNSKISTKRKTAPLPYITSSLQQDASNKLNFRASHTMKVAQKLYEGVEISDNEIVGLITYMRTDGLRISEDALKSIHLQVTECYGEAYAVQGFRRFGKKVKNAQEAHEAIRPTDIRRHPSILSNILEEDALKLYTLIWCQTMACQMSDAKIDQISVNFGNEDESLLLRSSGSAISFPGYLAVFKDNKMLGVKDDDDPEKMEDGKFSFLSQLKERDAIDMNKAEGIKHLTEPPPRYSEGTLVKKLEELGIGRPSTYAPILKTLEAREYVTIKSRRIYPEFRGRMVSAFLSHYFPEIIEYSFTADMESQLDSISCGHMKWKNVLNKFWESLHHDCGEVMKIEARQVEKMLEQTFGEHLYAALPGESRACPVCHIGTLTFKVSRHGAGYFLGCDKYPKCSYIARTMYAEEDKEEDLSLMGTKRFPEPKILGNDPNSNQQVFLKCGPYGNYVQLGDDTKGFTPKRANVSQIKDISAITLEDALDMLRYPVNLGKHPEDKELVELRRTKTGFVIRHRNFISMVPKDVDHQRITLDMAVRFLKSKDTKKTGRPSLGKSKPRGRKPKRTEY